MLSLCFRNRTLERSVNFIPAGDVGQKEPSKPHQPDCCPHPSPPLPAPGRGLRDHHSDSGMQTLSSFRVQREETQEETIRLALW